MLNQRIIAIVSIAHDYSLLPYYLEYYRKLGVDMFYISFLHNPLLETSVDTVVEYLKNEKDVEVIIPQNQNGTVDVHGVAGGITELVRQNVAREGDWVIPADLDEFNVYPLEKGETLKDLAIKMELGHFDYILGEIVDRVAQDKTLARLKDFNDGISIWNQYPLELSITKSIGKALTSKILFSKWNHQLLTGHHLWPDTQGKVFLSTGTAFHFKWREGLLRMLDNRIIFEKKSSAPWVEESLRIKEYFTKEESEDTPL
jgi:hypothetical protein